MLQSDEALGGSEWIQVFDHNYVDETVIAGLMKNKLVIEDTLAKIAENGGEPAALVRAIGAALAFRSDDDPQAVELAQRLDAVRAGSETPEAFVESVTGIGDGHPLFAALVALVRA